MGGGGITTWSRKKRIAKKSAGSAAISRYRIGSASSGTSSGRPRATLDGTARRGTSASMRAHFVQLRHETIATQHAGPKSAMNARSRREK